MHDQKTNNFSLGSLNDSTSTHKRSHTASNATNARKKAIQKFQENANFQFSSGFEGLQARKDAKLSEQQRQFKWIVPRVAT